MNKNLRVVFMGTPEFSIKVLQGLIDNYNVVLVVTQPDKIVGRKKVLTKSCVKLLAEQSKIEVFQPIDIRTDYDKIVEAKPDLIVTCAYGQIIPKVLLELPYYGCLNVHASLLPKLRGGAPIHKSIINGDDKTGITIMYMDIKMDAGDIISQESIKILEEDTLGSLSDKLSIIGRDLLLRSIPLVLNHQVNAVKQDEKAVTFAFNIKREEEKIDFTKSLKDIYNQIRGLNPVPGAYALLDGKIVKLYDVCCSNKIYNKICGQIVETSKDSFSICVKDGVLIVKTLQCEGKKKTTALEFLNGRNNLIGKIFK